MIFIFSYFSRSLLDSRLLCYIRPQAAVPVRLHHTQLPARLFYLRSFCCTKETGARTMEDDLLLHIPGSTEGIAHPIGLGLIPQYMQ